MFHHLLVPTVHLESDFFQIFEIVFKLLDLNEQIDFIYLNRHCMLTGYSRPLHKSSKENSPHR